MLATRRNNFSRKIRNAPYLTTSQADQTEDHGERRNGAEQSRTESQTLYKRSKYIHVQTQGREIV